MNTKTMHVFSSRAPFNDLPEDVLHKIDEHLKNYNAYEKRVNEYVSRYGDMLPNNERNRLINEITPTEKKNETKQNLFIYSITMFQVICQMFLLYFIL